MKTRFFILIAAFIFCQSSHAIGFEMHNDFTQEVSSSVRKQGTTQGASRLLMRSWGPSTHARLSFVLMRRQEKDLKLLVGPFARFPLAFSFTGYGSDIRSPQGFEWGADLGFSWFGYARTVFCYSPSWTVSFQTAGLKSSDIARFSATHVSYGVRLEVPVFFINADPDDHRIELGLIGSYQFDRITKLHLEPVNFSSSSSAFNAVTNSQATSYRWLFGAFINVRVDK